MCSMLCEQQKADQAEEVNRGPRSEVSLAAGDPLGEGSDAGVSRSVGLGRWPASA